MGNRVAVEATRPGDRVPEARLDINFAPDLLGLPTASPPAERDDLLLVEPVIDLIS